IPEMSCGSKGRLLGGGAAFACFPCFPCAKRNGAKANMAADTAARAINETAYRYLMWRLPSGLRPLLLLLRLGPLAGVFGHLDFNCLVAALPGKGVGVNGLPPHATPAVAAKPFACGNKHELRTTAKMPVALGRNKAHQELIPSFERILRPAIRER